MHILDKCHTGIKAFTKSVGQNYSGYKLEQYYFFFFKKKELGLSSNNIYLWFVWKLCLIRSRVAHAMLGLIYHIKLSLIITFMKWPFIDAIYKWSWSGDNFFFFFYKDKRRWNKSWCSYFYWTIFDLDCKFFAHPPYHETSMTGKKWD